MTFLFASRSHLPCNCHATASQLVREGTEESRSSTLAVPKQYRRNCEEEAKSKDPEAGSKPVITCQNKTAQIQATLVIFAACAITLI